MNIKTVGMMSFVFLAALAAFGQQMGAGRGPGRGMSNYDPKTEMTVAGTVQEVQLQTGRRGNSGTHAVVKTQDGLLNVHMGPTAFLAKEGLSLAKGDSVEITGSKVTVGGKDAFIAREVKKDGKSYVLRDSAGKPIWSGRRR